ncbi:MAG: SIS domain-containing protein [Candidatus Korarchaeota archaeon NZ13-K]|nr:MAG: SIS domain-containing protein [Candidatus Korarchaeota archaeon NZ13-K]
MILKEPGAYMRAEIYEQPEVVERTLRESLGDVRRALDYLSTSFIYVTGSGSSFHASLVLSRALMRIAGIRSTAIQASELPEWIPHDVRDSALIALSQSGESKDVLIAVETFRRISSGSPVIAITNTPKSTLHEISDASILTRAGEERAIAATKTYTTQLAASFLLATELADARGRDVRELRDELIRVPNLMRDMLAYVMFFVKAWADRLKDREFGFILGRGPNYPTALESALKLRETANLHYVGYSAREFLHGPIQLVAEGTPVILIGGSGLEDVIQRIRALGGELIRVDPGGEVPIAEVSYELSPIVAVVPMQLLSLEVSLLRGLDPDKPEKLTKVVK